MTDISKNDNVSWNTPQGKTTGIVVDKLTEKTEFDGQTFNASKEEPYFKVKSDATGKEAVHKSDSLSKEK